MFSSALKTVGLVSFFVVISTCVGCDNSDNKPAWKAYVAQVSKEGLVLEVKRGQELQIPGHPGYVYRGKAEGDDDDYDRIEISYPDSSEYYQNERDTDYSYDRRSDFYSRNCYRLTLPVKRKGDDPDSFYGDADAGSYCFLGHALHVIYADDNIIRYVIDASAIKKTDDLMALDHFVHYQTGTVMDVGGTLPGLIRSKIHFSASFGKGMGVTADGNTVQIDDATLVLRVKTADGMYTIETIGNGGSDRQQSNVGLAAALTKGSTVRFPVDLHIYKQVAPKNLFSSSKIGRLDAENLDVQN
jgi:hypothetical protein